MNHNAPALEQNASGQNLERATRLAVDQFMSAGASSDPKEVVRSCQQAMWLIPDDHAGKPKLLSILAMFFLYQFECTGMLSDVEDAITNLQQAISLTPNDHADKPERLHDLGIFFQKRFDRTRMLNDIEEAINNVQKAILLTPDDHTDKPKRLLNLGVFLQRRFDHTGMLDDIEEAIKNLQRGILLAPDSHSNKPALLNALGISFQRRFKRLGMLNDVEEAIKNLQRATLLIPDSHADKPGWLSNLGLSFQNRFEHTGVLSDIEEAIKYLQQAISLTPDGHVDKLMQLNNIGVSFQNRFEHTGVLGDIEEAIKYLQQVILLAPDDHTAKPAWLNNLGNSFQSRFEYTGMLSDIEETIKNLQQAVLLTPDGHTDKPGWLSNLGRSFQKQFEHTGIQSDIEEAIKNLQQAILLTPDDHAGKPTHLNNLGNSFQNRFEHTRVLNDIEEAIKYQQQALLLTPDGHATKPIWLNNLGGSFKCRFEHTGMVSDIEEAIKNFQQAISLTPGDNANTPMQHCNLGMCLQRHFERTGTLNKLNDAILHFQLAATSNIGSAIFRFRASRLWARLQATRDSQSALAGYSRALDLLLQIAWIGDPISTRHSQLADAGDISREATAFALDTGHPDLALEWLEQGRSVVWNQLFNLRTSVDDLRQAHPDICAEFTQASHELQRAATRGHATNTSADIKDTISLEGETQRHHRLAEKWDSLVETIRSLPGFDDFLLPKRASILMKAARSGPVVVVNVHRSRCDALILDQVRDQVLHIPLDRLHYNDVERMQKTLKRYLAPHQPQRWGHRAGGLVAVGGSLIVNILEQLYSKIVYPVLQALGLTAQRPDPSNLPRIWWCPTGPLTFLPLHAACRRDGDQVHGTFDYVISSYTPTVNALLEARAMKRQSLSHVVGVAMGHTPGQKPLPGVEPEMAAMGKLFSAESKFRFETLWNEQATGERVLTCMANSSWIHLACHAIQDKHEPAKSGFCLYDQRLAITDIISYPFPNADLAFLSACQTATGDEKASDEAVHITAAMLGAGYRSVIGTMWSIPDAVAPRIARRLYQILLSGGEPESARAAQALHEAVKEVRELDHDSFDDWVPFVHYGA